MNVPPYNPDDLKPEFPEFKQACDAITKEFMAKLTLPDKPFIWEAIKAAFEVGFMSGVSFMRDNPDL